ncbi:MAG: ParB/RepB/Spo0J family partition protein [Syntrophobacterales bacterium]|jgi:ParB family chromosome partitioning protein|nr:ParB/RepB/Spo0J family partition protein [Syntrophobacterales bacterium]
MPSKPSLGRGLGAMFPDLVANMEDKPLLTSCGIEEISPNRFQPRKNFHDQEQKDLVASIRKSGIIQPIVVRQSDTGYEIIAGERRWRAAQEAGLKNIPIVIRKASDMEAAELSLIENLQREGLNPLEEANAYRTLIEIFGQNHDTIAAKIGKDRSTVTNTIRLLKLPTKIQQALAEKKITAGHARSILALESDQEQMSAFNTISKHDLSVRKAEQLVQSLKGQEKTRKTIKKDVHLDDLEKKLSQTLMTKAQIKKRGKKGVIEIHFSSSEELGRLIELLLETTSS